ERVRLWRRSRAAPQGAQDRGTWRSQGGRQGQGCRRTGRQAQERSRRALVRQGRNSPMAILLVAEHDNATLSDQTAKALTAALEIGTVVDVLVAGKGAKGAADAAARLKGVRKVLLAEAGELEQ